MRGFLIDVTNGAAREVEISEKDHLGQYYDLIGCRCIDIAVRTIGGKPYNIVLDDEGLLVDKPVISAVDHRHHRMLVGNLLVFGMDEATMDLAPLGDEDVERIRGNMLLAIDTERETIYPVVVVEY